MISARRHSAMTDDIALSYELVAQLGSVHRPTFCFFCKWRIPQANAGGLPACDTVSLCCGVLSFSVHNQNRCPFNFWNIYLCFSGQIMLSLLQNDVDGIIYIVKL